MERTPEHVRRELEQAESDAQSHEQDARAARSRKAELRKELNEMVQAGQVEAAADAKTSAAAAQNAADKASQAASEVSTTLGGLGERFDQFTDALKGQLGNMVNEAVGKALADKKESS